MGQYIGLRYIPKQCGNWDNTKNTAYENLSVVQYGGASYTSNLAVPIGIDITNTAYWTPSADYNAQVADYKQNVINYKADTDAQISLKANQSDLNTLSSTVATKANQSDLTTLSSTVATKANQSDLTTLSSTVATKANQSDLTTLSSTVATKANQSDLTSEITQNKKIDDIKLALKSKQHSNSDGLFVTNILGDSVFHGQGNPDIPNDSIIGVLRKMFQMENNTNNYGYASMYNTINDAYGTYQDIHNIGYANVNNTGSHWSCQLDDTVLGGYSCISSTIGDQIFIAFPKKCSHFRICFKGNSGSFLIGVNGTTVVPSFSLNNNGISISSPIATNSNASIIDIMLQKLDNSTSNICGIIYTNDESKPILNNFSRAGYHLSTIDNAILDKICDCNILFLELGINDEAANTLTQFQDKLNYLHDNLITNGTYVIVVDTIWTSTISNNLFKQALYNFSQSLPSSIYLNLLEVLNIPRDMLSSAGILQPDNTHTTPFGSKLYSEYISKKIEFNYVSKDSTNNILQINENVLSAQNDILNLKTLPQSNTAPLQNNWVDFGTGYDVIHFVIDNGRVTAQGTIKGGITSSNTLIFTFPIGFRPPNGVTVVVSTSSGFTNLVIGADGGVRAFSPLDTTATFINFSFLTY